jgi:hypothetical protein
VAGALIWSTHTAALSRIASVDQFSEERESAAGRVAPSRSRAQREDALRRATAVRRQRAQLKRDLKAGSCAIEEVLTDPPAFVQTAKVADLLFALPKYGPVKVNKLLSRCRMAPSKTIGGLSDR